MLASPKIDGIRCTVWGGVAFSRSLKPIPNAFVTETIRAAALPDVLDGELVVGPEQAKDVYRRTTSGVMSRDGEPDFTFWVFDVVRQGESAAYRQARLQAIGLALPAWCRVLPQKLVSSMAELDEFEAECLTQGFEGVILRHPDGVYKHGRSTAKEGLLLKVKRYVDSEAEVVGVEELMHNANSAFENELGYTARSTAKEGLVPAGVLGALICRTVKGVEFKIGTGFTAEMRATLWDKNLVGKLAKYKHFEVGAKDAPRHPVFLGFRHLEDM
jgi:DNA ligase-1